MLSYYRHLWPLLILMWGCASEPPAIDEAAEVPKEFRSPSLHKVPTTEQKEKLKASPREGERLLSWLFSLSKPYFSKNALEEGELKFRYYEKRFHNYIGRKCSPQKACELLNKLLIKEGGLQVRQLEELPKPFFGHFLPYALKGELSGPVPLLLIAGLLLRSCSQEVTWQSTPDGELYLAFPHSASTVLLLRQGEFQLASLQTLQKAYPTTPLASDKKLYYHPLSLPHLQGLYAYHLGRAALFAKELREAMLFLQLAYKLAPERPEVQKAYGGLLIQSGRSEEALEGETLLKEAVRWRSWDEEIPLLLGDFYYRQRNFQRALYWYNRALEIRKSFAAFFRLARVCCQTGARKRALKILSELLKNSSLTKEEKLQVYVLRGNLYLEMGREKEGLQDLRKALSIRKNLPEVWGTLGEHYLKKEKYLLALQHFKEYIKYETDREYQKNVLAKIEVLERKIRESKVKKEEVQAELKEQDTLRRMEALKALFRSQNPDKEKLLWEALKDKEPGVRVLAVRYLVALKPSNLDRLLPYLKDESPLVRGEVLFAIKQCEREDCLPSILPFLEDTHPYVRDAALKALQEICGEIQTFGYDPMQSPTQQKGAIQKWKRVVKEFLDQ